MTVVRYQLPVVERSATSLYDVKLKVYNVLGQEVVTLVDEVQDAGYKSVEWNAINLSSGVYYYKLTAGSFTDIKKMLLVK